MVEKQPTNSRRSPLGGSCRPAHSDARGWRVGTKGRDCGRGNPGIGFSLGTATMPAMQQHHADHGSMTPGHAGCSCKHIRWLQCNSPGRWLCRQCLLHPSWRWLSRPSHGTGVTPAGWLTCIPLGLSHSRDHTRVLRHKWIMAGAVKKMITVKVLVKERGEALCAGRPTCHEPAAHCPSG